MSSTAGWPSSSTGTATRPAARTPARRLIAGEPQAVGSAEHSGRERRGAAATGVYASQSSNVLLRHRTRQRRYSPLAPRDTTSASTSSAPGCGRWVDVTFNPLTNAVAAGFDLYAFSVIFTWDLPALAQAVKAVPEGADKWIGGPAASSMAAWVEDRTGVRPVVGPDPRFERQLGDYKWCRTTRGCPVAATSASSRRSMGRPCWSTTTSIRRPWSSTTTSCGALGSTRSSWSIGSRRRVSSIDFNSGFEPLFFEQKHVDLYGQLPAQVLADRVRRDQGGT